MLIAVTLHFILLLIGCVLMAVSLYPTPRSQALFNVGVLVAFAAFLFT